MTIIKRTDTENALLTKGRERALAASTPWWSALAKSALDSFEARGLPHRRVEEWKYTDLRSRLTESYSLAQSGEDAGLGRVAEMFASLDAYRLYFNDGYIDSEKTDLGGIPEGVTVMPLSQALSDHPALLEAHVGKLATPEMTAIADLNAPLMTDGVVVHIAARAVVDKPILAVFQVSGGEKIVQAVRNLFVVEEGARATIIEGFDGGVQDYLTSAISEVKLEANAELNHIKIQSEGEKATHTQNTTVAVDAGAVYRNGSLIVGGAVSRNEIFVRFIGEGAEAVLNGAFLTGEGQHSDTTTKVAHAVPNCSCEEVYRGVLNGRSRGVFQGKIAVEPHAQKTDSRMMIKSLLLSDRAEMDSKPELEIYADDVKCAHGATVGSLDEEALFYLRSRGIDVDTARSLLITAFLQEALDPIADANIREVLDNAVTQVLAAESWQ